MILQGDCLARLAEIPDESVHCVVTSPPYFGLRNYGFDGQIGLEETPDEYVSKLVEVFREVRRVLRADGVLWLNLGDSYAGSWGNAGGQNRGNGTQRPITRGSAVKDQAVRNGDFVPPGKYGFSSMGIKPKDLIGIPWRVAFALQADGWYLRSDIIWCLSGGAKVYARTQKGDMPSTIKDLVRLDPKTVKLWNGSKWTQVLSWTESPRPDDPIEITLRSGERIGCTPCHYWPTQRGNVAAKDLMVGDIIKTTKLPEDELCETPGLIPDWVGWFVGLYLAEGSRSDDCIQIASHVKEIDRLERLTLAVVNYGGSVRTHQTSDNGMTINVHGKMLHAIIDTYIGGKTAKDKHLTNQCWARSNEFLRYVLDGYLHGDGHYDKDNRRWRIGFTRNYALESDLRTLCARLGVTLKLSPNVSKIGDKEYPSFRGEIRFERSGHHSEREMGEIVSIGRSRARKFWDVEVEDDPHLFALASGVLTHNSKPNPMPESVTDRCTKSHEYIFMFTKSARYFYDTEAVKEPSVSDHKSGNGFKGRQGGSSRVGPLSGGEGTAEQWDGIGGTRNRRDVWIISTKPYRGAHFATFPPEIPEICIKAGTSERGCCPVCGAPWVRVVERTADVDETAKGSFFDKGKTGARDGGDRTQPGERYLKQTIGFSPSCSCGAGKPVPCTVLDPFAGSGTTGAVAKSLGRDYILIEANPDYIELIEERIKAAERPPATLEDFAS